MTPKQIRDALTDTSEYANATGRPDRFRIMLTSGTIIDSDAVAMESGILRCIDANRSIIYIDPPAVILIANALMPAPDEAEIAVQAGELQTQKPQ